MFPCSRSLFESRVALRIKHPYEEQGISYKLRNKDAIGGRGENIATQERKICDVEIEIPTFVINGNVKFTVPPDRQK